MSTIVKYFTFLLSLAVVISGFGQSYTIQGTIQDENGESLPYATVMLKDTSGINMIKAELLP